MKNQQLYFFPFLLLLGLTLFSCKTKNFTPSTFEGAKISFGSGGGFTGKVNKHVLLENGQLFNNKMGKKTFKEVNRLKKKEVTPFFKECDIIMESNDQTPTPANLYYFITYENDGNTSSIIWGERDTSPSPDILAFFDKLSSLVNN